MDRELLLEIGCEELPAGWLPDLTNQVGEVVAAELRGHRLSAESPAATYSTPRRLTVHIARVPERQTDLEELITGPPVSASFGADGAPTKAAAGFAAKQGVDVPALERVQTPKGEYLAFRKRQRGKAAIDVLPDVLGGALRGLAFPKLMHWDATLDDGKGDLLFGRPIRWILFLYGGRVVPFTIGRSSAAQTSQVQEVSTGAVTYGHRFLTTSGRAGRAIKVRSFEEYRARLLENFVIVERSERHNKIARELDAKAQRLHGRISHAAHDSGLLHEVPDLVEYPSVVAGTFSPEFLSLPDEVLTTTLIHHQHYFPLEGDEHKLLNAFLAVINTEPDNERTIARNAERVVTARLRDATFFWEADRKVPFESRVERLGTLLFHKKLGSYQDKAERIARLAKWIAKEALGADETIAGHAETAARLAKADLTSDMVREFTELQGTMGGIYTREEGQPEEVWKAIYFHYLPVGVEANAPPTKAQLGKAAVTWAAVSLADKLDTIVGLFSAGEKPTGSRDPYGLRRAAQGVVRILVDLQDLFGKVHAPERIGRFVDRAASAFEGCSDESKASAATFLLERFCYLCEARGFSTGEVRAIRRVFDDSPEKLKPLDAMRRIQALREMAGSDDFVALAELFKRVKNITKAIPVGPERFDWTPVVEYSNKESREDAEKALISRLAPNEIVIHNETVEGNYKAALAKLASFRPEVGKFFDEVMVMADDDRIRNIRLSIMARLRDRIMGIADISEMFGEAQSG